MLPFLDSYSTEYLDAVRPYLLWAFVVATCGVILGVGLEGEGFKKRTQHIGWLLLLASLGLETYLTILIFSIDSETIHRQQTKIEQLLAYRHLSPEQTVRLIAVTKKFPSSNFIMFTVAENEPFGLGIEIGKLLRANGWHWLPCDGPFKKLQSPYPGSPPFCWTIVAGIQIEGSHDRQAAMDALVEALRDPAVVGMENVRAEQSEAFPTIAIMAGSKR